jgi:hypothetical protein
MKLHGYIGLLIIVAAEVLLFSGNRFVGGWFTPIVWTGYILFIDALVYRLRARSLLVSDRVELLIVVFISIAVWWLFELYNAPRFWRSDVVLWWHYHNLAPNPYLRRAGYDWAFATIFPALFLTTQFFAATVFAKQKQRQAVRFSRSVLFVVILFGAAGAIIPLVIISPWFAPLVWLSFIFLLDPINYLRGWPSIVGDVSRGDWRRLLSLLASGGVCGVLWEFWNYWAITKWTYTVPYFGDIKIFEMPVLGYLGFLPFTVECWVMYIFLRSLLTPDEPEAQDDQANIWIES